MIEIIKLYNKKYGKILTLEYPTTDEQIQKTYKYLLAINDEEIQDMLKDVKIPIVDTLKEYFILNDDKDEVLKIDYSNVYVLSTGEINKDMVKGKTFIFVDNDGIRYLIHSIEINHYNDVVTLNYGRDCIRNVNPS